MQSKPVHTFLSHQVRQILHLQQSNARFVAFDDETSKRRFKTIHCYDAEQESSMKGGVDTGDGVFVDAIVTLWTKE